MLHGVLIALGRPGDLAGNKERRVETHTELADEVRVSSFSHGLQEVRRSGLGDGAQIVDEISLRHANTRVGDGDGLAVWVVLNLDLEILRVAEEGFILHAVETRLLQRVSRVQLQARDLCHTTGLAVLVRLW